jgi:hypothetical protein
MVALHNASSTELSRAPQDRISGITFFTSSHCVTFALIFNTAVAHHSAFLASISIHQCVLLVMDFTANKVPRCRGRFPHIGKHQDSASLHSAVEVASTKSLY